MFKQFLMKKMMQSQLSKIPEEARPLLMHLVENHPDLLMKMAEDMQALKSSGKSDQDAFMEIGEMYKAEIQKIAPKN